MRLKFIERIDLYKSDVSEATVLCAGSLGRSYVVSFLIKNNKGSTDTCVFVSTSQDDEYIMGTILITNENQSRKYSCVLEREVYEAFYEKFKKLVEGIKEK